MPKRKLAMVLFASMGVVLIGELAFALSLFTAHRSGALMLIGPMAATLPGFVVAVLAWRGKLPAACAPTP
jgi:F0F1-type ATP synthase assembly protein I